jgi:hypothetical protein
MTAFEILAWLDRHARQIVLQDLNPERRQKNRVILSYLPPGASQPEVVGVRDLSSAVNRAATRIFQGKGTAA